MLVVVATIEFDKSLTHQSIVFSHATAINYNVYIY